MPKAGGIPEKTNDFNSYLRTVIPLLSENHERLNISKEEIEALLAQWGENKVEGSYPAGSWNYLYKRKINPLTSTSVVKQMLRAKRLLIDKMLRSIYGSAVWRMTPEEMLITGRKKRTAKNRRMPLPERAPQLYVKSQTHSIITLRLRDPKFPSLRRNPPEFRMIQIDCEIFMEEGKTQNKFETSGRSIYRMRFEPQHTAKKARIHSRYFNRRGHGPWSDWLEVFVI